MSWRRRTVCQAIYPARIFVDGGGPDVLWDGRSAVGHRVADIVDQILKGQRPSDIPVFQPNRFELVINLKPGKDSEPHRIA